MCSDNEEDFEEEFELEGELPLASDWHSAADDEPSPFDSRKSRSVGLMPKTFRLVCVACSPFC